MNAKPILAPIMRDRTISLILAAIPLVFLVLEDTTPFHWVCPFHALTNLPCPGCGMTRALISLAHLDVVEAVSMHPFSPLLVLGWTGWVIISVAPSKTRMKAIETIELIERKTAAVYLFFALFIAFGLARLLFAV